LKQDFAYKDKSVPSSVKSITQTYAKQNSPNSAVSKLKERENNQEQKRKESNRNSSIDIKVAIKDQQKHVKEIHNRPKSSSHQRSSSKVKACMEQLDRNTKSFKFRFSVSMNSVFNENKKISNIYFICQQSKKPRHNKRLHLK
jgi:hypothetical protein